MSTSSSSGYGSGSGFLSTFFYYVFVSFGLSETPVVAGADPHDPKNSVTFLPASAFPTALIKLPETERLAALRTV